MLSVASYHHQHKMWSRKKTFPHVMQDMLVPLAKCLRSGDTDVKRLTVSALALLSSLPLHLSGANGRRWRRSAAAVMGSCKEVCEIMATPLGSCVDSSINPAPKAILQHVRLNAQVMEAHRRRYELERRCMMLWLRCPLMRRGGRCRRILWSNISEFVWYFLWKPPLAPASTK